MTLSPRIVSIGLLCLAWLVSPAPAAATHAGPLAGQWHLDADTSSAANDLTPDSSGHALDAATANGTLQLAGGGRFGNHLSSTNTSVLAAGPSPLLQPTQVTLLAWVRHSTPPPQLRYIAGQGNDGGTCNGPSYALYTGVGALTGLQFFIRPVGDNYKPSPVAGNGVWDGQWHLVAGTFDGSTVRLYIDGVEVGAGSPAPGATIDYGFPGNNFFFGGYPVPACGNGDFPGGIDEVRVYGRALTGTEIGRLATHPGPDPPVLVPDGGGEPPPVPAPENVRVPEIRGGAGGALTCDPGEWRNVTSGFTYQWLAFRNPTGVVATTQDYKPDTSVYGYPIACLVTTVGPAGPVTATSSWAMFTSAGLNLLPPAYGDVRVRGIDVFQTVQPNQGARMFGYKPDATFAPGLCGGGTPSNWRSGLGPCRPIGDPQFVNYEGVTLDQSKRATAVVYVDVAGAAAGDPGLTYDLELSATRTGSRAALGPPVVRRVTDPPRSDTPWVREFERDGDYTRPDHEGIPITLPAAWTSSGGTIKLHARLRFPDRLQYGTASFGSRQCDLSGCELNDSFTLNDIPFTDFPPLRIATVQLRTSGQAFMPAPERVLSKALQIVPGGDRIVVQPYRADLEIGRVLRLVAVTIPVPVFGTVPTCNGEVGDDVTTRSCRFNFVSSVIQRWIADHPARPKALRGATTNPYDVVFGVHDYDMGDGGREPGWATDDITAVSRRAPATANATPYFTANAFNRPLTAAAHELGHILTAPHASACNGGGNPEPWPEVDPLIADSGRLQSTKFVRRPSLRGPTRYQATVDGPYRTAGGGTTNPTLFDLMSYCAGGDSATADGSAWLSARNWNRFSRELGELSQRLSARGSAAAAGRISQSRMGFAVGVVGPGGGQILNVVPADGDDDVPASDPSSPFRLLSLDSGGRVLLEAGITLRRSTGHVPHTGGTFVGPVAPGAAAVTLVEGSTILHRMTRSRRPTVRLTAPRRGIRVSGKGRLSVRWRASDPDRDSLDATIDFSADNGRTWRTVYGGPSRGRASVPGRYLSASKRARVRVSISDGFSETSARSGSFTTQGVAPRVRIVTPQLGDPLSSGERTTLVGNALDDLDRPLAGRALTWFAGSKRLGRGARIRARLPLGTRSLRLVARDRTGRTGVARVRVRVEAPQLRIVSLTVPLKVGRKARSVRVLIRTSAPAALTAGGRRYRLRARRTTLTIRLPSRPAVGIVSVPFRLAARDRAARGTIRGTFTVART